VRDVDNDEGKKDLHFFFGEGSEEEGSEDGEGKMAGAARGLEQQQDQEQDS